MKAAVAVLEPHMEKADQGGKGRVVLATVKGDVHDIGKNLVDIILTNNGYTVHNLGIKQPISAIIDKAEEVEADAIGMSGLLVMDQLRQERQEGVRPGREAPRAPRVVTTRARGPAPAAPSTSEVARSDVRVDVPLPTAPFLGDSRIVKGIPVRDIAAFLNESALFRGQWQLRPSGGAEGWEQLLETEARPRLRALLDQAIADQVLQPAVVYGYYPCNSDGNDLVVWRDDGSEWVRFSFPRQRRDRRLCIADYFRPVTTGDVDVVVFHVVTMGRA